MSVRSVLFLLLLCPVAHGGRVREIHSLGIESVEEVSTLPELKANLYDVIQRVRKVADKLTPESGTFMKLWWGGKLGDAQKKLAKLEEGIDSSSELRDLLETPVKDISSDVFVLPAGAWPIMVEIWDDETIGRQAFIGEVGVPFLEGEHDYDVPLAGNDYQYGVSPAGATVQFTTSITKSSPSDCVFDGRPMRCVEFEVSVSCKSAANLPNTDSGVFGDLTDAYCKVRVQSETSAASQKFETKVVSNDLSPSFGHTFTVAKFTQPLIEPPAVNTEPDAEDPPESSNKPFTIDEMTLSEQLESTVYNLATKVFLDSEKCKSKTLPAACRLVQKMGSFAVDKSALEEVSQEQTDPTVKRMAERLVTASINDKSLLQFQEIVSSFIEVASGRAGCMACVMAGRRAARRRGGGGGGSSRGGGDGGGAGWFFLGLLLFILIMCLAA